MSAEGNESAHVDVVNGGYDQKSFLLMAPQHEATVRQAFEEYRRRIFPFSIREERFRDAIGTPPAVIHVFSKVNENLSSIDKLFTSTELWKQTTAQSDQSAAEAESRADSSLTPGGVGEKLASTTTSTSDSGESPSLPENKNDTHKPTMPPTPSESLRDQYGLRSTVQTEASTDSNNSVNSRLSSMSTSTARFQEIEARIQRQQKELDRKDRINTERLERMERQFTRFDTLEANLMNVMEKQAGVGVTMNHLSDKISALMDMIARVNIQQTGQSSAFMPLHSTAPRTAMAMTQDAPTHASLLSESSDRQSDRFSFPSPSKKKYRAGLKNNNDFVDIGVIDEDVPPGELMDCQATARSATTEAASSVAMSMNQDMDILPPFSQAIHTPLPDDDLTEPPQPPPLQELEDVTTDLVTRYNSDHRSHGGESAP
jgi:hypothetical protein